ncbi:hypothetical protein COY05_02400 [Candidatus Peregrinibacteria bacterium CG_4_10_14_0_2_um_filter_38_24]|nr:MAG: hypothetical protein COY05_02400 [Candidatus Peregrinibacteria bacterium CG_4_10_14_0_2_um_filter_38_24]PJC38973.1 MAG: hypothetical protein CO044_02180 [Candidatus Peregrinibacteria bacterium CG_4_9_14_0_2_um_filter_38_9]
MFTSQYKLSGLDCESCVKMVKMDLGEIAGITEVGLDLSGDLNIKSDREIDKAEIVDALKDTEYKIL